MRYEVIRGKSMELERSVYVTDLGTVMFCRPTIIVYARELTGDRSIIWKGGIARISAILKRTKSLLNWMKVTKLTRNVRSLQEQNKVISWLHEMKTLLFSRDTFLRNFEVWILFHLLWPSQKHGIGSHARLSPLENRYKGICVSGGRQIAGFHK